MSAGVVEAIECGTYAGYHRHKRLGEEFCTPCRQANREYMRKYRAKRRASDPDYDLRYNQSRQRAYQRLAAMHPTQFSALLAEERDA